MFEKNNSIEKKNTNISIDDKIKSGENKILNNISNEYGITNNNLEKLAKFQTSKGIEGLKNEINKQNINSLKEISNNNLENILDAINKYQKEIKEDSKNKLAKLKNDTEKLGENNKSFIISKLSKEKKEKYINNPKTNLDNVIGGTIGLISSSEKILKTTYDLGKGIITLPLDLYLIATKKAKYDKKI